MRLSDAFWTAVMVAGVGLFVVSFLIIIIGNIYLGITNTEFAKHDESMYACFVSLGAFWWAYLGMLVGVILAFIGKAKS